MYISTYFVLLVFFFTTFLRFIGVHCHWCWQVLSYHAFVFLPAICLEQCYHSSSTHFKLGRIKNTVSWSRSLIKATVLGHFFHTTPDFKASTRSEQSEIYRQRGLNYIPLSQTAMMNKVPSPLSECSNCYEDSSNETGSIIIFALFCPCIQNGL